MERDDILIRNAYLEWISDYCGQTFDIDNLPAGVELALRRLMAADKNPAGVASQSVADMSITYVQGENAGPLNPEIKRLLQPYIRMRVL